MPKFLRPSAGVLLEIRANEGETVEVGSVVGVVGAEGSSISRQSSRCNQPQAVEETAEATSADVPSSRNCKSNLLQTSNSQSQVRS